MRRVTAAIAVAAATMAAAGSTMCETNSVGLTITSDRDPDKFADPKDMKYELSGSHAFDGGVIVDASLEYNDRAFSDRIRENLEGAIGYRVSLNRAMSLTGSAGIGEHWRQQPTASSSSFVLRIGCSLHRNSTSTSNILSRR